MGNAVNLSEYIAQDLGQRLLADNVSEDELTLVGLGERYGVSFTPIRRAIDKLVERSLLVRLENGRVEINRLALTEERGKQILHGPVSKPLDSDDWDAILSREIIRTSLIGDVDFLREESTALKHGIGRTALRQILHRLSGTGLITHVPRRGWRVRPFETKDLDDFLVVREILECQAMDLSKNKVDNQDLAQMLAGNMPGVDERIDNRLHDYFIEKSDNRYVIDFFKLNAAYYTAILNMATPEMKRVSEMAAQHCQVLRCVIRGDWDSAKDEMRQHIRAQRPIVLEMIEALRSSP